MPHQQDRDNTSNEPRGAADVSRRIVLRGATVTGVAVPFLAACGGGGEGAGAASGGTASGNDSGSGAGGSGGAATTPVADVPVGGGTILADQKVVVTQPRAGDFKGFTAVCTHQGCIVNKIQDGQIVCPCHGSQFSIKDGSVTSGPAPAPLAAKDVTVKGDQLSVG